jgi:hypothetical protein
VKYYLDGQLVETVPAAQPQPAEVAIGLGSLIPTTPEPDAIDHSRLPGHIDVDYVRYYRPAKQ